MYVSRFVKQVIGVEINRDAVEDAKINAKINQISNIRFVCEDAGRYMTRLAAEKKRLDVVIMDPPRAGSTPEFLDAVTRLQPERLVYISCNPQTQKRDLEILVKKGWQVRRIQPVDMFPHTEHVETCVLLQRRTM